jgi:caa(3)-type oxidase subunit IV
MSDQAHTEFNANRIFIILFIATAIEIAWGELMPGPNWWVWGGLIAIAFYKGLLILQYFMHFKFEGMIVKCLIAPTPILVMVLIFALMPDVGSNSRMDYDLTDMADPTTGEIVEIGYRDPVHGETEHGGDGH